MKSKLILAGLVIVALGVGFFAGIYVAGRAWGSMFQRHIDTEASNQAHFSIRALSDFREGKQANALELMESGLDNSLLTYVRYERLPPADRNEAGVRAIQVARDYRLRHPWQNPTPELREAVQKVLSLSK
jgi:hypothetical protein